MKLSALAFLVAFAACSSAPDFRIFSDRLPDNSVPTTEPDVSVTPLLVKQRGTSVAKELSWAGLVERVTPEEGAQAVVVRIQHRHLAIDTAALQKDKHNVVFELSEKSAGPFDCYIPFKSRPSQSDWAPFLKHKRVLACTGPLKGMNNKGVPVVEATQLEAMDISRYRDFEPEIQKETGRIILDDYNRPRFKPLAPGVQ